MPLVPALAVLSLAVLAAAGPEACARTLPSISRRVTAWDATRLATIRPSWTSITATPVARLRARSPCWDIGQSCLDCLNCTATRPHPPGRTASALPSTSPSTACSETRPLTARTWQSSTRSRVRPPRQHPPAACHPPRGGSAHARTVLGALIPLPQGCQSCTPVQNSGPAHAFGVPASCLVAHTSPHPPPGLWPPPMVPSRAAPPSRLPVAVPQHGCLPQPLPQAWCATTGSR